MTGIYKITNKINGKCYIGQSINIKQRWKAHRSRYQVDDYPLYRAMRKYGLENFNFEVIEECSQNELNDKEIYWIDFYDSANNEKGYNLTIGGNNIANHRLTEEQIMEIYSLLKNNTPQTEIASKYNVAQSMISMINSGIYYPHSNINYPINNNYHKKEWHCEFCGVKTSKGYTKCPKCYGKMIRVVERPDREQLKQLIRALSFTKIGQMYNVSPTSIRRWCDTEQLPRTKKEINSYSDEEWEKI